MLWMNPDQLLDLTDFAVILLGFDAEAPATYMATHG